MALLEVTDLHVAFAAPEGLVRAVRGVSFTVDHGRTLAIVGESGSGKTVAAQTILRLNAHARVSGRVVFGGRDLLTMADADLRAVRGGAIGMVFQNPHTSLHPAQRVGDQIAEVLRIHEAASRAAAHARAIELLKLVGIPHPERRVHEYPHEFSGGMLQRAMIAMAIALKPRLLIADEPTTALDVTVQAQILALLRQLQQEFDMALLLITHDLGVVSSVADDVMVMYAGRAMEYAPREVLFRSAHHPYTNGLLHSLPDTSAAGARLTPIRGQPPAMTNPPAGCPFHTRCDFAQARCEQDQAFVTIGADGAHRSACWLERGSAA